jgi:hypothetical protein
MTVRQKTITTVTDTDEPTPDVRGQGKRPDSGQFRLQVDRQTKASYPTFKAAEQAGLAIKQGYPLVQVAIYDATGGVNTILELPKS